MTITSQPLRVLVADDHAFMRRGIRDIINEEPDMCVVAEASDGQEAVSRVRQLRPDRLDLVLMDIEMPNLDGIQAAKQILANDPDLPIIMLTVSTLDRDLFEATEAGAAGFLSKSLTPGAIVRALRDFREEGALPMSGAMAARVVSHLRAASTRAPARVEPEPTSTDLDVLTPREREVLELIAHGARDRDIATELVLTESTVKKHVQNILRKLDARNRTEAAAHVRLR